MASTSDFRNGLCIKFNDSLYSIIEFQHVKPGKGPAFVRTKLKSLNTGKIVDNTFNAGVKIETARVETLAHQFLYKDDTIYHFMDINSFDQVSLEEKLINAPQLMKEGQEVDIKLHRETNTILACELPHFVELKVKYTEPGLKGDTANRAMKSATLETGYKIQVPLFISMQDIVKI